MGVERLGEHKLIGGEIVALLFIVGLTKVTADQRIGGTQGRRDLDLTPPVTQFTIADHRQPMAEARQWGGLIKGNRSLKVAFGALGIELSEVGKAEDRQCMRLCWVQTERPLCHHFGTLEIAQRQQQLGEACQQQAVIGGKAQRCL